MILDSFIQTKLIEAANNHRIFLVGETHGIQENAWLLKEIVELFLDNGYRVDLALEFPQSLKKLLDKLPETRPDILVHPDSYYLLRDGRLSEVHLEVLTSLVGLVDFWCIDDSQAFWDEKDAFMFQQITSIEQRLNPKNLIIAPMGNIHSQTSLLNLMGQADGETQAYLPLGYRLMAHQPFVVELDYLAGSFFNYSVQPIPPRSTPPDQSHSHHPDKLTLTIPQAHPTKKAMPEA